MFDKIYGWILLALPVMGFIGFGVGYFLGKESSIQKVEEKSDFVREIDSGEIKLIPNTPIYLLDFQGKFYLINGRGGIVEHIPEY